MVMSMASTDTPAASKAKKTMARLSTSPTTLLEAISLPAEITAKLGTPLSVMVYEVPPAESTTPEVLGTSKEPAEGSAASAGGGENAAGANQKGVRPEVAAGAAVGGVVAVVAAVAVVLIARAKRAHASRVAIASPM
jgi:hypothetical protein